MNDLTSEEITIAVRKAYSNLDENDQKEITRISKILIKNLKSKHPNIIFGPDSALELIACVGMAINDKRIRFLP